MSALDDKVPLTTITVAGSQPIACPSAAASSLARLAQASGAPACQKAVAEAIDKAQVAAVTITAPAGSTASSTVVNVPCSSCPARSKAVAVPQVAPATGGAPAAPAPTAAPGDQSPSGALAPASGSDAVGASTPGAGAAGAPAPAPGTDDANGASSGPMMNSSGDGSAPGGAGAARNTSSAVGSNDTLV